MNAANGIKKAYIERNAKVLKAISHYMDKGKVARVFYPLVARELEVSTGLVNSLIYHPHYPYYQEARDFVKEEIEKDVKEGKVVSPALCKLVGYAPPKTKTVPIS